MPDFISRIISSKLLFFFFSAIFFRTFAGGEEFTSPTMIAKLRK